MISDEFRADPQFPDRRSRERLLRDVSDFSAVSVEVQRFAVGDEGDMLP